METQLVPPADAAALPLPPAWMRLIFAVLAAVVGVTGLVGIPVVVLSGNWAWIGLEIALALAGVFGVLIGLGRFGSGPALAMLAVGGTVLVCGLLSEPDLVRPAMQGRFGQYRDLFGGGGGRTFGGPWVLGISTVMLVMLRVIAAAVLIGLAALAVILRNPGPSVRLLVRAVLLGAPVLVVLAAAMTGPVRRLFLSAPAVVAVAVVIIAFFVLGSLLAASVHCLIRGFSMNMADGGAASPREQQSD